MRDDTVWNISSMPDDENSLEFRMSLYPDGTGDFDEDAIDRIMDAFLDAVVQEGYSAGGSLGKPQVDPEKICKRCEGIGLVEPVPEERKCPTCDGTGEVEPNAMSKEEWDETYGTEPP